MLALAEILGLILLNALLYNAFTRWKMVRRTGRSRRTGKARPGTHYPQHPSPAAFVRPVGID